MHPPFFYLKHKNKSRKTWQEIFLKDEEVFEKVLEVFFKTLWCVFTSLDAFYIHILIVIQLKKANIQFLEIKKR